MSFGAPYLLLTLIAIPIAAVGYELLERRRRRRSTAWSRPELLPNTVRTPPAWVRRVPAAIFLLALAALLLGFAKPERVTTNNHATGPTVAVVLDVSGSMAARDVGPSRLDLSSQVAARFIRRLPARDLVAVLTFGDRVRLVVSPTTDRPEAIAHLPRTITPKSGTSLGDGIVQAIAAVAASSGTSTTTRNASTGLVVVFSDGAQTAGGTLPGDAGSTALVEGIPVDTVAVGTPRGTVTQQVSVDGFSTSVQYPVPVDPGNLVSVSKVSRGGAFQLSSAAQAPTIAARLVTAGGKLAAPPSAASHTQRLSALAAGLGLLLAIGAVVLSTVSVGRFA